MSTLVLEPKKPVYQPEKLSMTDVLIDNLLATRSGYINNSSSSVRFLFKTQSMLESLEYTKYIKIQIWGKPAILMLPYWPFSKDFNQITTDKELHDIPVELALITLSIIYEKYIEELSQALSTNITLLNYYVKMPIVEGNDDYKHRVYFSIEPEAEKDNIEACLLFGSDSLQNFFHIINEVPVDPYFTLHKISSCLYFEAGKLFLNKGQISSLESGDVLVIDSSSQCDEQHLTIRLTSGHKFLAKKTDTLSYSILEEIIMEDNDNNEQNIPLNEIPLLITFDLGGLSMSLDEINKLGVGYTLELKKSFTDLVTIRINNKVIGKGEIVDVGNRAGVRITQLDNK